MEGDTEMSTYTVEVRRTGKSNGTLIYRGKRIVRATCWWNPNKRIPANATGYRRCYATRMATRRNSKGQKREAIHIPNVPGFHGVFIHMGNSPSWSDGCIVIREESMLEIWNDIEPKDGFNVTVKVTDS